MENLPKKVWVSKKNFIYITSYKFQCHHFGNLQLQSNIFVVIAPSDVDQAKSTTALNEIQISVSTTHLNTRQNNKNIVTSSTICTDKAEALNASQPPNNLTNRNNHTNTSHQAARSNKNPRIF